ncbi:MAG: guanylate kinase [Candidatus Binatia bacterium]
MVSVNGTELHRKGHLFILSGPSGSGKTTVCARILTEFSNIALSVSFTTRKLREGERDGVDYRFVDDGEFDRMVESDGFAEWAEVYGNRYGTSVESLESALREGQDLLLDIDVQGAAKIKQRYPQAVATFLLPPSLTELRRRLRRRATDATATVEKRLATALSEIRRLTDYDYIVVNEDLEEAAAQCCAIVRAERSRLAPLGRKDIVRVLEAFGAES